MAKANAEVVKARIAAVEIKVGETGRVWARTPKKSGGQGSWYELKPNKAGTVICQCMGFVFSAKVAKDRTCKHLQAVLANDDAMRRIGKAAKEVKKEAKKQADKVLW